MAKSIAYRNIFILNNITINSTWQQTTGKLKYLIVEMHAIFQWNFQSKAVVVPPIESQCDPNMNECPNGINSQGVPCMCSTLTNDIKVNRCRNFRWRIFIWFDQKLSMNIPWLFVWSNSLDFVRSYLDKNFSVKLQQNNFCCETFCKSK